MREFTGYLALGVTLVMGGVALAAEDPIDQNFERIIDAYRSSSHSPAEKRKLLSSLSKIASRQSTTAIADPPDGSVHSFEASINPPAPIKKDKAGLVLGPNLKFFLRQDFADIGGSLDAPTEIVTNAKIISSRVASMFSLAAMVDGVMAGYEAGFARIGIRRQTGVL